MKKNFIDLRDFTKEELEEIIALGEKLKKDRGAGRDLLKDKNFGLLFGVASTRTRVSFQAGIRQMGGTAEYLNTKDLQLVHHESIKDTAAVLGRYLDGLIVRMYDMDNYGMGREAMKLIADNSKIPVINALDDKGHPCQVLADILTLKEKFGDDFRRKKIGFSWVYSERQKSPGVTHSMLTAASLLGMNVTMAFPEGFDPDSEFVEHAKAAMKVSGGCLSFTNDAMEASDGADVIYVKDWKSLQMSKEEDIRRRNEIRQDWTISPRHFEVANPGAIFMNCLPIIRGQQATQEVIDRPDSILYDEAENRLHIQKAILSHIFKSFLFVVLAIVSCFGAMAQQRSYTVNGKTIDVPALNRQVEHMMEDVGIPGLSVAVVDHGRVVFYNSYGYKSIDGQHKERIDNRTNFEACSLSKSFIVFAAYLMVDKGLLDLDKPLCQYLPYQDLEHDPRYKVITARMVLSHTSGIENHRDNNDKNVLEIVEDPGKSFIYSGEGYIYLSKVIEKLIGMPVETYLKEMEYKPLQLKDTYTTGNNGAAMADYALGYDAFGKPVYKERTSTPDIAGRIYTNAGDYGRLMAALFDMKHISRNAINELVKPGILLPVKGDIYYSAGYETYYSPEGDTLVFQGGDNNGYKGMACYSIVHQCGIVFFANADRADKIGSRLCEWATGLDISAFYVNMYSNVYPSAANTLMRIYKEKGAEEMRVRFDRYMSEENADSFRVNDMVELVYYLKDKEYNTALYIAGEYLKKHPGSEANFVYGRWLRKKEDGK